MTRRAFTLVEILIVVVILGILAAAVIPQFTQASTDSREATAAIVVRSVQRKISAEYAKNAAYPTTIDATWFENGLLPTNPFFPTVATTIQTVNNANNLHPANKTNANNGTFWYNRGTGAFRARVQPGANDAETIARYNKVNGTDITALNQTN